METIAVIPARKNSKGLPRKNIRLLGGRPLISWSIDLALRTSNIDRVVVSTDDRELAEIALDWGAEVPFIRPQRLASDTADLGEAIRYTLNRMQEEESYVAPVQVTLLPTTPFRSPDIVEFLINKLKSGHKSVVTYAPIKTHKYSFLSINSEGRLVRHPDKDLVPANRTYWYPTGYLIGSSNAPPAQIKPFYRHCIIDPAQNIDIDYYSDLLLARKVLENGLFKDLT